MADESAHTLCNLEDRRPLRLIGQHGHNCVANFTRATPLSVFPSSGFQHKPSLRRLDVSVNPVRLAIPYPSTCLLYVRGAKGPIGSVMNQHDSRDRDTLAIGPGVDSQSWSMPTSFASGRYLVRRPLGQG